MNEKVNMEAASVRSGTSTEQTKIAYTQRHAIADFHFNHSPLII